MNIRLLLLTELMAQVALFAKRNAKQVFRSKPSFTISERLPERKTDIYLPEKSVQNAPVPKLSENNVSIRLEPLSGQAFLAEMSDSGLMEKKNDGYQLGLTLYDQGLSAMAGGLEQLSDISTLTVALSVAAAVLVVVVIIIFHF